MRVGTRPKRILRGHEGPVMAVRFNAAGTYCMTCGSDRSLKLWNPHRGAPTEHAAPSLKGRDRGFDTETQRNEDAVEEAFLVKDYRGPHGYDVLDVAIAKDNDKFVSCGGDKAIFIWDVATGRVIRRLQGHDQRVNAVALNEDATVAVSGSYDKSIRCWDLRAHNSYEPIQILSDCRDSVTSVILTQDEIIASSVDGCVRIYDLRAGKMNEDRFSDAVGSLSISHDSLCLLSACLDDALRLTEKESGTLLNTYRGHKNNAYKVEAGFSQTDEYVISGGEDGRIVVWDLVEGTIQQSFQAHRRPISAVATTSNSKLFLSSSYDGTVKVWE